MLQLHLNDLAKRVGITPSALSQIENAKTFPSIITLKAIAEQLRITVGELIGENEIIAQNPIVKKNEIKLLEKNNDGIETFLLSQDETNKYMDTYLIKIPSHKTIRVQTFHLFLSKPNRQIFCYVIKGNFVIVLNEVQYTIESGDNVYFSQNMFEELFNTGKNDGELIWVISPSKI